MARPDSRRPSRGPSPVSAAGTAAGALQTTAPLRAVLGVLVRFVSCGALGVGGGFAWRFSVAPSRIGPASSLAAVLSFLVGFIIGGLGWYVRDLRVRRKSADRLSDERLVFSFVVFAAIPFAVLLLVGLVWLLSLAIG